MVLEKWSTIEINFNYALLCTQYSSQLKRPASACLSIFLFQLLRGFFFSDYHLKTKECPILNVNKKSDITTAEAQTIYYVCLLYKCPEIAYCKLWILVVLGDNTCVTTILSARLSFLAYLTSFGAVLEEIHFVE